MRLLIIIYFTILLSFTAWSQAKERTVISATACAKSTSDGTVVECEPSEDALNSLDALMVNMQRINSDHPGPSIPSLEQLYSVRSIDVNGSMTLENGVHLKLAGLDCNHQDLIKYLKATFVGKTSSKLSYIEASHTTDKIVYAYIWEVNTNFGEGLGSDGIAFGPMTSNVNETALTSSWCSPIKQDGHIYYERYLQLSNLAM